MKQLLLFSFFLSLAFNSFAVHTIDPVEQDLESAYNHILDNYSCNEILNTSVKDYKQSSPTKFTFNDRLLLILAKREINDLRGEGKTDAEIKSFLSEESKNSGGAAFALGLLLGILGLIICYLVDDLKKHVKRAWLGLGIRVILAIIIGVVYVLIAGA